MRPQRPQALFVVALLLGVSQIVFAGEFDGAHLFVASIENDAVYELTSDGVVVRAIGEDGPLVDPRGIVFTVDGELCVTSGNQLIFFDADGDVTRMVSDPAVTTPRGLAIGPGGEIYTTSADRVAAFDRDGNLVRTFGAGSGLGVAVGITFARNGNVIVASGGSNEILFFSPDGVLVDTLTNASLSIPTGIAVAPNGDLYVTSLFNSSILVFDATLALIDLIQDPSLVFPSGLATGPDGHLYVSSLANDRIVVFDADHVKERELTGLGQLAAPEGVAFSPWRFKASLSGTVAPVGGAVSKLKGKADLSWVPGSGRVLVDVKGSAKKGLGIDAMVAHGISIADLGSPEKPRFLGAAIGDSATSAILSLSLDLQGKSVDFGPTTAFRPKKGSGKLLLASPSLLFQGTIKITGTKN